MIARRVSDVWVGSDHPWSAWVKRPLFASLTVPEVTPATESDVYRSETAPWAREHPWWLEARKIAIIVDLPGPEAVELGLLLGRHGFRPILLINAASDSGELIDMAPVLHLLTEGARFHSSFPGGPDVLPAFVLDARREGADADPEPGRFDNRWTLFPADLPPAERLGQAGVQAVMIVQDEPTPRDDVRAIAWMYQRGGLDIRVVNVRDRTVASLASTRPSWLVYVIGQLRRRFAFRRQWDGSYGHRIPIPPDPSHG
jgi:hypothetical protein